METYHWSCCMGNFNYATSLKILIEMNYNYLLSSQLWRGMVNTGITPRADIFYWYLLIQFWYLPTFENMGNCLINMFLIWIRVVEDHFAMIIIFKAGKNCQEKMFLCNISIIYHNLLCFSLNISLIYHTKWIKVHDMSSLSISGL